MKLARYQQVVLARDVSSANLKQGDLAMLVDFIDHPSGGEPGVILEIFNALGESIDVVTVPISAIAALNADQMPTVRSLQTVA